VSYLLSNTQQLSVGLGAVESNVSYLLSNTQQLSVGLGAVESNLSNLAVVVSNNSAQINAFSNSFSTGTASANSIICKTLLTTDSLSANTITVNTLAANNLSFSNVVASSASFSTVNITSSVATTLSNAYGFFSFTGAGVQTGTQSGSKVDVGLAAYGSAILGAQFIAVSDERIKTRLCAIDADTLASCVAKMHPTSWQYKDVRRGSSRRLGFIAQELQTALPQAVVTVEEPQYIPNMYVVATRVRECDNLYQTSTPVRLRAGERVLVILSDSDAWMETQVEDCNNCTHCFRLTGCFSSSVFLYGSLCSDLKSIDYDGVIVAAIGAIQQLQRRVDDLEKKCSVEDIHKP
jgi:Chaperone of endosialidase